MSPMHDTLPISPADEAGSGAPATFAAEEKRLGFWMALPTQLLLAFIVIFPLLMQLYISLTAWTPLTGTDWPFAYRFWNNFANFAELATDGRLWGSLGRTALIVLVCVPTEFLLGLGLALLFTESFFGKRTIYSILLMPMMVVPAVAGYMFFMLFQSGGPVNSILSALTGTHIAIAWLSSPKLAMVAVMASDIWQWTPLMFLILLAGLVGVPEDQIRAATILGASPWQRFWTIILTRIRTVIVIALAIRVVEAIKIFDTLYIMTGGGPGISTETISVYIYKTALQALQWSYVAAIALAILVALSIITAAGLKRLGRGAA